MAPDYEVPSVTIPLQPVSTSVSQCWESVVDYCGAGSVCVECVGPVLAHTGGECQCAASSRGVRRSVRRLYTCGRGHHSDSTGHQEDGAKYSVVHPPHCITYTRLLSSWLCM